VVQLRRRIRRLHPDLVQAHYLAGPGWLAALVSTKPLVVTAWGSDVLVSASGSLIGRLFTRLLGRRADAVTFDAEPVRDVLERLGVPPRKLRRIVFGADSSRYSPGRRNPELLRRLGVPEDTFVVLSPRGLRPVYEAETIMRGFAQSELGLDARLLVRVDSDDAQWQALERLASSLDVSNRVVPYKGVDSGELADLLRSSDVVVSVPSSDGTSVVLLEALFTERPVVVSDLPANREWIRDQTFGQIVPVKDASALASALTWIRENPKESLDAAARAATIARECGDAAKEFARAEALYREFLPA
jgi:glycosyltransferase involved in cell wall biosynthesis